LKFSALIVERSRKILFLSFVAAVVGITLYGIIWNLHTRESSKEFILSHLKEVIVAEVHSQNTFNIDGELNRIVDSWSKTQEFPLRVDVYIDGKHWAHGGPMRAFGFPSASDSHSEKLATGQVLSFDVNMDLTGPILRLLAALLVFIGFFVAVYFSLKKGLTTAVEEISTPLEDRINRLGAASQNLLSHAKKGFVATDTQVRELQNLDQSLSTLFDRINSLESEISDKKYHEGQFQMAKQVTHALNGTLSAFSLYIDQAKPTDPVDRDFLKSIVQQISSISGDLIGDRKRNDETQVSKIFDLIPLVSRVIEQKGAEVQRLTTKKVCFQLTDSQSKSVSVVGSKAKLELALVNLITNAIEAIKSDGTISVSVEQKEDRASITIADTGCGIPTEVLPMLMKEGATFGKENGHGFGLFHVKSIVDELHGSIAISSIEDAGTQIEIEIPTVVTQANSQSNEIVLFEGQELVIVDDEECIHLSWNILIGGDARKMKITHLYSDEDFEKWMQEDAKNSFSSRLFLFDYDLKGKLTGLELIEKYQLMFESHLVTGMANDEYVKKESKRLKVKTISKDELPNLHLRLEKNIFSSKSARFFEAT
jgi:signal transduction histidine kinase